MELPSKFAPAERSSAEQIKASKDIIESIGNLSEIFNSMTSIAAIIDKNRQIVYANTRFLNSLGFNSMEEVTGLRPGEIVNCIHHDAEPCGCGTSAACKYCGAVNAILESQKTNTFVENEARITSFSGNKIKNWDLKVSCSPLTLSNLQFYVFTIEDISSEKRKHNLERIFFHDVLNLAGGLNGLLTILKSNPSSPDSRELIHRSEETSRILIEEILMHRQLKSAENGDLVVHKEEVNTIEILRDAIQVIKFHSIAADKVILINENSAETIFDTDRSLLKRVLVNMLKNALEATASQGTVNCGCRAKGKLISFWVQNMSVITEDIQMQIFQRSFSTKGDGRGIGTYSIKLLVENYLNGKVSFVSNDKSGTIFTVELNAF